MPPNKPITSNTLVSNQIEITPSATASGVQSLTNSFCCAEGFASLQTSDISINNTQKNVKYKCIICEYTTSRKSSYDKHLFTAKHMNTIAMQSPVAQTYMCNCGKEYKHHSSLWNHKKNCNLNNQPTTECENVDDDEDTELPNNNHFILEILKQNQDFKEIILEKLSSDNHESLIIELLKQNQDFKNLMIEQNKYMMEQSKQIMELMKTHSKVNSGV
jgi:hypothetical protein